ncbi:Capsule assembly protein Wzi [Ekhidna lutea]|uniref:Capsule assembly protein Wzi n=1 Tax=Ekhidna lutea TaxID=447679 RepID=A0A239FQ62_EKHLU|nr:capsule assembly Wzi family protein [Ekhidna lutea]SNS59186.1 Capsule assembly protein Wzi [Ekhidna lutea]
MRNPVVLSVLTLLVHHSIAQVSIPGIYLERIDKLSDTTTLSLYTSIRDKPESNFKFINPLIKATSNSLYPRALNDGPVWIGKGFGFEGHGGFNAARGNFSFTFFPVVFLSQNENHFRGDSVPEFRYQFSNRIDWVQRYGNGAFVKVHLGQSELRFNTGKFIASLSTQNYSLGPATFNPIVLSRQAGGFPHLRLGIEPVKIQIKNKNLGKIETNLIFGLLDESEYFDNIPENDKRYINILAIAFSPDFLQGLKVGFNKSLYKQTRFFEKTDLLSTLFILDDGVVDGDTLSPNDAFDQLVSLTVDWKFKEIGLRIYSEFAKNDFTSKSRFRYTASEPEHTRAYTIGFEKEVLTKKGNVTRIGYEHTNLSRNQAIFWRRTPSYYQHGVNRNGYTNDGQIIGAGIGPGGNSDHLSIEVNYPTFKAGLLFQRIEYNRDYFVTNIANLAKHDIEYSAHGFLRKEYQSLILLFESSLSYNYNKYFQFDRVNFYFGIGGRFKLNQNNKS